MTTLDPSEEDQFHKDVNTYVAKHDLLGMFQRLLTEVTVTKPKDPISFLISVLEKPKEGFRKIIVLGKTNTKKEELCQRIANEYKLVHITLEELIQQKGGIVNAFKQALNRSEVTSQGWIISGFPQDRIQALQLQELAQYPNHVLVLETNTPSQDDYNVHFDANIADVLSCFEGVVTLINADVYPGKVYSSVKAKLDGKPNQLKVLVLGAPGSGKTTQCERIVDTFRVVRVNLEELPYEIVNDPTHVPTSLVEEAQNSIKKNSFSNEFQIKILKWRLSQNDCLERGWVVDGFSKDVRVFDTEAIFPDYVIELTGVDEKTIKERIDGRRMNPETHKIYHVRHNPPGDIRVIQIPKDKQTPSLAPYEQNITTIRNELGRAVTQVDAKLPLSVVSAQVINTIRGQVQNVPRLIVLGYCPTGREHVCEALSSTTGAPHITLDSIIRVFVSRASDETITRQTELGKTAKFHLDKNENIPDETIVEMVTTRLLELDSLTKGFVLDGFPQTKNQAMLLKNKYIAPSGIFLLDSDDLDDHVLRGRSFDPLHERVYHEVFHPPKAKLLKRLVKRREDSLESAKEEISQFRENVQGISETFSDTSTLIPLLSNQMPKKLDQDAITQTKLLLASRSEKLASRPKQSAQSPLKLIILGPPAGGKGTCCEVIKKEYNVVHLSTGDVLRENIKNQTPLGLKVKPFMDNGQLVPDELVIDLVMDRLEQQDCKERGWLLDGFPRTPSQSQEMVKRGILPDAVVVLTVDDKAIETRMGGRRTDPVTGTIYHVVYNPPPTEEIKKRLVTRDDDTPDKIKVRLSTYYTNEKEVTQSFKGLIKTVDGNSDAKSVGNSVIQALNNVRKKKSLRGAERVVWRSETSIVQLPSLPLKLIILGPPAGGKGTCCEVIKNQYNVVHLSTGDILRENIDNRTLLGSQVKPYVDKGLLVPDDLIMDMVTERLSQKDCKERGWLLDGFPRTGVQAEHMIAKEILPDAVICLDVQDKEIEVRMGGKRTDPVTGAIYHLVFNPPPNDEIKNRLVTRPDDTVEKIKIRLDSYKKHANDVMLKFHGAVRHVDGNVDAKIVGSQVINIIDKLL